MESNNETSRIGVQFGEDFEGDGKVYGTFSAHISKESATHQIEQLKQLTLNELDYSWSLVFAISVSPQNKQILLDLVKKITTEKPTGNSDIHKELYRGVEKGKIEIKSMATEGKVYISIHPCDQEFQNMFIEPFNMFFDNGLSDLASNSKNSIEALVAFNQTVEEFINQLESGNRLLGALLTSIKAELKLSLSKNLGDQVKAVAETVDPEFANSPPFLMLRYFKGLDVDLRFNSTNDLPEAIRKKVLFGQKLADATPEARKLKEQMDSTLNVLIDTIDADVDVYFTIPNFVALKVGIHAPNLSTFIKNFGGHFVNF